MRDPLRSLAVNCFIAAFCLAFTASAQIYSPVHIFSIVNGSTAPLAQGSDGTLYGVSALGGAFGPPTKGTVFKVQPDGSGFSIVYSFTNGSDGPAMAGLIISGTDIVWITRKTEAAADMERCSSSTPTDRVSPRFIVLPPTRRARIVTAPARSAAWSCLAIRCMGRHQRAALPTVLDRFLKSTPTAPVSPLFTCLVFRGSTIRLFRWQAWYYPAARYMARHTAVAEAELSVQCSRLTPMAVVSQRCMLFQR